MYPIVGVSKTVLLIDVSAVFCHLSTTCYLSFDFGLFYTYKQMLSKIKSIVTICNSPDRTTFDGCHGLDQMSKLRKVEVIFQFVFVNPYFYH